MTRSSRKLFGSAIRADNPAVSPETIPLTEYRVRVMRWQTSWPRRWHATMRGDSACGLAEMVAVATSLPVNEAWR